VLDGTQIGFDGGPGDLIAGELDPAVDALDLAERVPLELLEANVDDGVARQAVRFLNRRPMIRGYSSSTTSSTGTWWWDCKASSRRTVRSARQLETKTT
jgi:hypothetical protein